MVTPQEQADVWMEPTADVISLPFFFTSTKIVRLYHALTSWTLNARTKNSTLKKPVTSLKKECNSSIRQEAN